MASDESIPKSVFLGLGSNLGDREANLREARERIEGLGLKIVKQSSIYETEPVGFKDQPWFLNQVIELGVDLDVVPGGDSAVSEIFEWPQPVENPTLRQIEAVNAAWAAAFWVHLLFTSLQDIERSMGREKTVSGGPRVIDIDVLLYGSQSGFWAKTRGDGEARIEPGGLVIPHPRMHQRRFVLEPLCEIASNVVHPQLGKTARELLDSVSDQSIVRLYGKGDS